MSEYSAENDALRLAHRWTACHEQAAHTEHCDASMLAGEIAQRDRAVEDDCLHNILTALHEAEQHEAADVIRGRFGVRNAMLPTDGYWSDTVTVDRPPRAHVFPPTKSSGVA